MLNLVLDVRDLHRRPRPEYAAYAQLLTDAVLEAAAGSGVAAVAWEAGPMPAADVLAVLDGSGRVARLVPTVSVLYDLSHLLAPRLMNPLERWRRGLSVAWTARQSAFVLAPSRSVATAASTYLRVPEGRVAWLGSLAPSSGRASRAEVTAFRESHHLGERYFALPGPIDRRHQVEVVISAWSRARARLPGVDLVALGPVPDRRLVDAMRAAGLSWIGDAGEEATRLLVSGAIAALSPAPAEGTSIRAWAAMAVGAPVLTAAGGGPAEVVGNAGLILDPARPEDWAEAMVAIAGDSVLRNRMAAHGLRAVAALTRADPAQRLLRAAAAAAPARR